VPRRDPAAIAAAVGRLLDDAALSSRLGQGASRTGARYDIQAFVHKMERLYDLLHDTSRTTGRQGVRQADLTFLEH
jgi:glycosyltransferase involved in cell wall biosynthesis